jgi:hypothetical protein
MTNEERARAFAAMGQHTGEYRVVWSGEDDPMPWVKDHEI